MIGVNSATKGIEPTLQLQHISQINHLGPKVESFYQYRLVINFVVIQSLDRLKIIQGRKRRDFFLHCLFNGCITHTMACKRSLSRPGPSPKVSDRRHQVGIMMVLKLNLFHANNTSHSNNNKISEYKTLKNDDYDHPLNQIRCINILI